MTRALEIFNSSEIEMERFVLQQATKEKIIDKQEKSSQDTKYLTMKEWKVIKQKEEENEEGRGNFEKVEK